MSLPAGSCWAATVEISDETEQSSASDPMPFLLELYEEEDYNGLRTEALRADHETSDPRYRYLAALARVEQDQDDGLRELTTLTEDSEVGELATLAIASVWMEEAPRLSAAHYRAYLDLHPEGAHRMHAAGQEAYALAAEGRFGMARTVLESEGVAVGPELLSTLSDPPKWKRPALASFLSGALPGAGQLYAGQPREAASALLVNAMFIGGMTYAARQEQWAAFGVLAFFGVGFYSGNVYGAADAAIRHNRGVRDDILDDFEAAGLEPAPPMLGP
ncbi:MAG TPA: hypothetical protein QGF58_10925 [Myxococcota bacterium]|nr:hypothetical protein [Myxococcota bacterium]